MFTETIIWDGWDGIFIIGLKGIIIYVAMILLLRLSGKRTLTKMNSFDFIITIALGSTVSSIILDTRLAISEGITALILLILLQYAVTFTAVRSSWFNKIIKSEPTVLFSNGAYDTRAMKKQRITKGEILSSLRQQSKTLDNQTCVVLENNGKISVYKESND